MVWYGYGCVYVYLLGIGSRERGRQRKGEWTHGSMDAWKRLDGWVENVSRVFGQGKVPVSGVVTGIEYG